MKGNCVQYVVKIGTLNEVEGYITITEENRELTELIIWQLKMRLLTCSMNS